MTWRDVLAAGAFDPIVGKVREILEPYLAEAPGDERRLNLAIQANLEEYGPDFIYPALRHLVVGYEPDMEADEVYGLFRNALPLHVTFPEEDIWDESNWAEEEQA